MKAFPSLRAAMKTHKPVKYILPMFPYPSGSLHLGHFRIYSVSHVLNLYYKLFDFQTIHPIGWDSFGLPAERAAIANGTDPRLWTLSNIAKMKQQLLQCGIEFDWHRELATHDPKYYTHTQRIFINLYKHGLIAQEYAMVNYDPVDQTVLANEQVIKGRGERSGALVESRIMKQYFVKTGSFAPHLHDDLMSDVLEWPKHVKKVQKNWIGRVDGGFVKCGLVVDDGHERRENSVRVFVEESLKTLNPEKGLVAVVGATNKSILDRMETSYKGEWQSFLQKNLAATNSRTLGFNTGLALHIRAGLQVPIFIAPFLVYDPNDCLLLTKKDSHNPDWKKFATENTIPSSSSPPDSESASITREVVVAEMEGYEATRWYALRPWTISRQRKWATPIPMITCEKCGAVPVPDQNLPVTHGFLGKKTKCPQCGGSNAVHDSQTLDTFFDSSWYYLRFLDVGNDKRPFGGGERVLRNVDLYVGGREHATMHLLYARLVCKCLVATGMVDSREMVGDAGGVGDASGGNGLLKMGEPFAKFIDVGVVQAISYKDENGVYIPPLEAKRLMAQNEIQGGRMMIKSKVEKMGKSKLNGIDPVQLVEEYGADALRFYMIGKTRVAGDMEWNIDGMSGAVKFIEKLENIVQLVGSFAATDNMVENGSLTICDGLIGENGVDELIKMHDSLLGLVKRDLERVSLHTITAHLYKFANTLHKHLSFTHSRTAMARGIEKKCVESLLVLSYPLTTETCARLLKWKGNDDLESPRFPEPFSKS